MCLEAYVTAEFPQFSTAYFSAEAAAAILPSSVSRHMASTTTSEPNNAYFPKGQWRSKTRQRHARMQYRKDKSGPWQDLEGHYKLKSVTENYPEPPNVLRAVLSTNGNDNEKGLISLLTDDRYYCSSIRYRGNQSYRRQPDDPRAAWLESQIREKRHFKYLLRGIRRTFMDKVPKRFDAIILRCSL